MQQRHARRLVDPPALGFDDAVLDLVAHAQAVAAADGVGFREERDRVLEALPVEGHGPALLEGDGHRLGPHRHVLAPERDAHDRAHDGKAPVEELEVLRLVGRPEDVGIRGVRLLHAHLVVEAAADEVLAHLLAPAQLVDEALVEPRLVDAQVRVGDEAVAVEALDVVALEGAAVAPDVDLVLLHGHHQHRAGDGAPEGRGVEVRDPASGNVERAALDRGDALGHELRAALDQHRLLGPVLLRLARNLAIVRFVGLAEVGGVGVGDRTLLAHPRERGTRVESAGEGDADLFAGGQGLQDRGHGEF